MMLLVTGCWFVGASGRNPQRTSNQQPSNIYKRINPPLSAAAGLAMNVRRLSSDEK